MTCLYIYNPPPVFGHLPFICIYNTFKHVMYFYIDVPGACGWGNCKRRKQFSWYEYLTIFIFYFFLFLMHLLPRYHLNSSFECQVFLGLKLLAYRFLVSLVNKDFGGVRLYFTNVSPYLMILFL